MAKDKSGKYNREERFERGKGKKKWAGRYH